MWNQHTPDAGHSDAADAGKPGDSQGSPFGQWLREARAWCQLTPDQLAEKAHLSCRAVADLERGTQRPSRRLVHHLARVLTPPDVSQDTATELLCQGLVAAGLLTRDALPSEPTLDKLRQGRYLADIPAETEREISELIRQRGHRPTHRPGG
ncbi:MAG: helix-turn-helix transcriptional regulator [Armatimonadetes bacterium]|nr:helix-turn-helix transcriptional regulator [Armatimonadota bacterium]